MLFGSLAALQIQPMQHGARSNFQSFDFTLAPADLAAIEATGLMFCSCCMAFTVRRFRTSLIALSKLKGIGRHAQRESRRFGILGDSG